MQIEMLSDKNHSKRIGSFSRVKTVGNSLKPDVMPVDIDEKNKKLVLSWFIVC